MPPRVLVNEAGTVDEEVEHRLESPIDVAEVLRVAHELHHLEGFLLQQT